MIFLVQLGRWRMFYPSTSNLQMVGMGLYLVDMVPSHRPLPKEDFMTVITTLNIVFSGMWYFMSTWQLISSVMDDWNFDEISINQ